MPRTRLDRLAPETRRKQFADDFRKIVESHRVLGLPSYKTMYTLLGMSHATWNKKYGAAGRSGDGSWSLEEFSLLCELVGVTDRERLALLRRR